MTEEIRIENLSMEFHKYSHNVRSLSRLLVESVKQKRIAFEKEVFLALDNVNLYFKDGDRVALIGRNGAGKSTLLKTVAGIYPPTHGKVHVSGSMLPLLELGTGFEPTYTVRENIYLNGALLGFDKKQMREIEDEILGFAEIEGFSEAPLGVLSSGMKGRLAFSIASFVKPQILLLDEVFAAGDKKFLEKAKHRMMEIVDASKIVVFVSHQEELARELCSTGVLLHKGQVIDQGDLESVYSTYNKL